MANTGDLVSIKLVADRLYRNPLMKDMTYEFIIDNALELMRIIDAPSIYTKRKESINVVNYRASKPVNMMSVDEIVRIDRGSKEPIQSTDFVAQDFIYQGDEKINRETLTYSLNSKYINPLKALSRPP